MQYKIKIYFVWLIFLLLQINCLADAYIVIDNKTEKVNAINYLQLYHDKTKTLTIEDIIQEKFSTKFTNIEQKNLLHFGYVNDVYWFKLDVRNATDIEQHLYLEVDYPLLYKINFYTIDKNKKIQKQIAGDGYRFFNWTNRDKTPIFNLKLVPNESKNYYLKIESDGDVIHAPITVWKQKNYIRKVYYKQFFIGFFYGVLFLIVITNLFYYISHKDNLYLNYVWYIIFLCLYLLIRDGVAYHYFWPFSPWIANHSVVIAGVGSLVFYIIFLRKAVNFRYHNSFLYKISTWLIIVFLGIIALSLLKNPFYAITLNLGNYLGFVAIIFGIIVLMKTYKYEYLSRILLFSMGFLILGSVSLMFTNFGLFNSTLGSDFGMKIGVLFEVTIIAFGLTKRFKTMLEETHLREIDNYKQLSRIKETANKDLEEQVKCRTEELKQKNINLEKAYQSIESQKIELEKQRNKIERQKERLEIKQITLEEAFDKLTSKSKQIEIRNKEIDDSIKYAKRIQKSIFPSSEYFAQLLPDSFIYLNPKEALSGDFYWIEQFPQANDIMEGMQPDYIMVSAVDCTGHGIPGALMSIIARNALYHAVNELGYIKPDEILKTVDTAVYQALSQKDEKRMARDGMDMSLVSIHLHNYTLHFSGAKNPIYIIRNNELIQYKGNRWGIGPISDKKNKYFDNYEIKIMSNDMIYLFSDGYADQFGTDDNKKFKYSNFKKLLISIAQYPVKEQRKMLHEAFENWKGNREQVDDVLVIGFRIK